STNGLHLAMVDIGPRSMTAAGGITTNQYRTGAGHGAVGSDMPATTDTTTARSYLLDTKYEGNLNIATVAAAFRNAQFAVVMLGTNDVGQGRPVGDFMTDLQVIVSTLEAEHIAVVLSTIPPHYDTVNKNPLVIQYNDAIRTYCKDHFLPLIDFYAEILARRPNTSWNGTLMQLNN